MWRISLFGTLRANFEYRQDNSQGSKPGTARSGNVSLLAKLADRRKTVCRLGCQCGRLCVCRCLQRSSLVE